MRDESLKHYVTEALKTWRKHTAAVSLATQSRDALESSGMLQVAVESAATLLFLANPGMDLDAYQRLFHLNHTEAVRIAGLVPKRQLLLRQGGRSKVLDLNVEDRGYWLYTSNPFDQARRSRTVQEHGFDRGLELLAQTPNPSSTRSDLP